MSTTIASNKNILDHLVEQTSRSRIAEVGYRIEEFRFRLADKLRDLRGRTGLTQHKLAEKLGVKQAWISKLENPNYDHTFESVLRYALALGHSVEPQFVKTSAVVQQEAKSSFKPTLAPWRPRHHEVFADACEKMLPKQVSGSIVFFSRIKVG